MNITQIFKSASDGAIISQRIIPDASATIPFPVAGDNVIWTTQGKTYRGRVKSRLITFGAQDEMTLGRSDAFEVSITLEVDLAS
jgi:hypothetical protein